MDKNTMDFLYALINRDGGYDYVVFTDGSGSTKDGPGGWAIEAFQADHDGGAAIYSQFGMFSNMSVNQAELQGILSFLAYLDDGRNVKNRILVVSDSEVTVKCGNKEYARNQNTGLWSMLDHYISKGNHVKFMWVPRNSNEFSRKCDVVSKEVRALGKAYKEKNH